jgi:hypothetical protein
MARLLAGIACSLLAVACGGSSSSQSNNGPVGPANNCTDFSGAYSVITQIIQSAPGTCSLAIGVVTPATYTFTQSAPSCEFAMTNSIYSRSAAYSHDTSQYKGHFDMTGNQAKVYWDSVTPLPKSGSSQQYDLTYSNPVDLTISPGTTPTISGKFGWHASTPCDGLTYVCYGSGAHCTTPGPATP